MSHRRLRWSWARLIALASAVLVAVAAGTAQGRVAVSPLSGAGSTLVAPLVAVWQAPFKAKTGVAVSYNPIGSGGGITAITNRQVSFGASDAPLSPDQFSAAKGVIQIPWALSAVAISYNVPNVPDHLKLTGQIVAAIYLGQITNWNDKQIKALNPGVNLPNLKITPVERSDGSGTTYAFTDYMSKVSSTFASKIGRGTLVNWPLGVTGKGNSGVAGVLSATQGAIAYMGVDYVLLNHLRKAAIRNNAGKFELPGLVQIAAAAATVKSVPANNAISISNPPGSAKNAYPAATFTWVIVPLKTSVAPELKSFITWAVTTGQKYAAHLLFTPISTVVRNAALKSVAKIHT